MSTQDLLSKQVPIFDVLRSRKDWQTAQPRSEDERKWYSVGFQMAPDRDIADPVSSVVPVDLRFWWALGVVDGLAKNAPRAVWDPKKPENEGSLWKWGLSAGVVGGIIGVGLLLSSGGKHE